MSKSPEKDEAQRLILDFKRYEEPAVRHMIIQAIEHLQTLEIGDDVLIVRALSSFEMYIGEIGSIGLDRLGLSLENVFDCTYAPSAIYKTRKTASIKNLNITERKDALAGVYAFKPDEFEGYSKLLIIDDVVTTGATACAIMGPILKVYPETKVTVFALAWTPTLKQQEFLLETERKAQMLHEPEVPYGNLKSWRDEDFENGATDISLYPQR